MFAGSCQACFSLCPSLPPSVSSPLPFSSLPPLAAIRYFIPSFGGKSYLAFKMMKAYHTVRIALEFRTVELSGLLLYNGQNRARDFISLALVNGFVELRWVPSPPPCAGVEEAEQPLLPQWPLQNPGTMLGLTLQLRNSSIRWTRGGGVVFPV